MVYGGIMRLVTIIVSEIRSGLEENQGIVD